MIYIVVTEEFCKHSLGRRRGRVIKAFARFENAATLVSELTAINDKLDKAFTGWYIKELAKFGGNAKALPPDHALWETARKIRDGLKNTVDPDWDANHEIHYYAIEVEYEPSQATKPTGSSAKKERTDSGDGKCGVEARSKGPTEPTIH